MAFIDGQTSIRCRWMDFGPLYHKYRADGSVVRAKWTRYIEPRNTIEVQSSQNLGGSYFWIDQIKFQAGFDYRQLELLVILYLLTSDWMYSYRGRSLRSGYFELAWSHCCCVQSFRHSKSSFFAHFSLASVKYSLISELNTIVFVHCPQTVIARKMLGKLPVVSSLLCL